MGRMRFKLAAVLNPDILMDELRKLLNQIVTQEQRGNAVPRLRKRADNCYLRLKQLEKHRRRFTDKQLKRWHRVEEDYFAVKL